MKAHHFNSIPTLDMRQYLSGDTQAKQDFCKQLCDTCHQVGFFYLQHHNIPISLMRSVLKEAKAFFELPQHVKNEIDISHSAHYRGYGRLQAETTLGIPDYKETYDLGLEKTALTKTEQAYQTLHGPNQWPTSGKFDHLRFRSTITQYIDSMTQLGLQIMLAISEGLGISSEHLSSGFDPNSDDAYAMLRLLHYPPTHNDDEQKFGVGPHVDAGCLVFLLQDDVGGLQVQNHAGDWIDAPPREDTFIVNIGEMLQLWTSHYFKATPHRVMNHHDKFRISAPFFFEPNLSTVIKPLSIFNQSAADAHGVLYGEHMLKIFERSFVKS